MKRFHSRGKTQCGRGIWTRGERAERTMVSLSVSAAWGCQSIGDIQIGLAGRSGINRFGRLELLVETTLVQTSYVDATIGVPQPDVQLYARAEGAVHEQDPLHLLRGRPGMDSLVKFN